MKTIDEMLSLRLISEDQHAQIGAWVVQAKTPEAIMQMPAPLWRALELASVLMGFDADLSQPLCLEAADTDALPAGDPGAAPQLH